MRRALPSVSLVLLVLLAVVAAGCGSSSKPAKTAEGERGGEVTVYSGERIGSFDPALGAGTLGTSVLRLIHRPLYSPTADDPLTPDLAKSPPKVQDGGRKVTVELRDNVRFGPPVNRKVRAADVVYAITRAFSAKVGTPDAVLEPFASLDGLQAFRRGTARTITGLTAPDRHTVVFQVQRADGQALLQALTSLVTAPVPPEYAEKFDAKSPSTYGTHPVPTGPYMIPAERLGKITGYDRDAHRLRLTRNPNWKSSSDFRPAYFSQLTIREAVRDEERAARTVREGPGRLGDLERLVRSPDVLGVRSPGGATWDLAASSLKR